MALTRKFLTALGIDADKVDEIIAAHADTVNALKEERDGYKADADRLPEIQKELDTLKDAAKEGNSDALKLKYDALKEEFANYKASISEKETKDAKISAYRALLKSAGVNDKRIDSVLKVSDIDAVELVDGQIKDADKLTESIKTEWADFIVTTGTMGAGTPTPPEGNTGTTDFSKMSDDEYYSMLENNKKK